MSVMNELTIIPGQLSLQQLRAVTKYEGIQYNLDQSAFDGINKSAEAVQQVIAEDRVVYGINTGFGLLANTRIKNNELE